MWGIRKAASATGMLRGIVGFMTFLAAFALRGGADDVNLSGVGTAARRRHSPRFARRCGPPMPSPAWKLGFVAAALVFGFFTGSLLAPKLRDRIREEVIIATALAVLFLVALLAAWGGGFGSTLLLALGVGITASAGKLSFDSIVQRDSEGANHGRAFAAFETRFQVFWVLGALIPVIFPISRPSRLHSDRRGGCGCGSALLASAGFYSGRSIRANHRPGASTSAGVGSSRSERQSRARPSVPARSTTPLAKAAPRSYWSWESSRPNIRSMKRSAALSGDPSPPQGFTEALVGADEPASDAVHGPVDNNQTRRLPSPMP